jgi:hypothetical protein
MRGLKIFLTALLLLALAAAGAIALFWEQLLGPDQKMHYGLVFSATRDYQQAAVHSPQTALPAYVSALTMEGNLGRALYLADLYHAPDPDLAALRDVIEQSIAAGRKNEPFACTREPAVEKFKGQPVFEALRFLEGYQFALLGDWASARNSFEAIDEQRLAPELRGYARYFRARSYRLAGDEKQQAQVGPLLLGVINSEMPADLRSRARYNLIAYYLSDAYQGGDGIALARDQELLLGSSSAGWAVQKAYTEIGEYYLEQGDAKEAWRRGVTALQTDPQAPAAAAAGKLCLETLEAVLHHTIKSGLDDKGALTLDQPQGLYLSLAQCAVANGDIDAYTPVFSALLTHVKNRARWEELRVALAMCYAKQGKLPLIRKLLTEANLGGFSDAATAALLYELARTEEDQQQWNDALAHYASCGKLGGPRAPEAWYGCYRIIKHVQDPLDLDAAETYLASAAAAPPENPAMGKAAEELLPLLIYRNKPGKAQQLARHVLEAKFSGGATWPEQARHEQLQEVAHTWLAWLAQQHGDESAAAAQRKAIPCRYWNYYELVNNYPPQPELASAPGLLDQPEVAGEYFAGLGLDTITAEFYEAAGREDSQLLQFFRLRNSTGGKSVATLQWESTQLLEEGRIGEQPLLDYVLALAYPRPFEDILPAAAKAFGVPAPLMYAIIKKESAFKTGNESGAGAQGLMQIMPDTASFLNNTYSLGVNPAELKQPKTNLKLGAANLRMLFDQLGTDNVRGVISAHNKGAGNYQKWQRLYPTDPLLFTELIPNEENESFSKLVWKYYLLYKWLGKEQAE